MATTETRATPHPHVYEMTVRFEIDPRSPLMVTVFTDGDRMGSYRSLERAGLELACEFEHRIRASLPHLIVNVEPGRGDPCVRHEAWEFVGYGEGLDVNRYRCATCGSTGEYGA